MDQKLSQVCKFRINYVHRPKVARSNLMISCVAPQTEHQEPMTVAITGGAGFIGSRLIWKLASYGHNVRVLTRDANRAKSKLQNIRIQGYFEPQEWIKGIEGCTGVVNLAGEPISTRWSPSIKQEILNSRLNTTDNVVQVISQLPKEIRPFAYERKKKKDRKSTHLNSNQQFAL
eukprot:TRINITY_DN5876_c0_g1_i3.p1 TRINITY_DN5876_c0_g1~~TRINITY_DN5876_c0_g1_i3.p1  ORF type:complete len:202 (-),score=-8.90 TRINITY_DN5876_c0_g1_i3:29-550(-)